MKESSLFFLFFLLDVTSYPCNWEYHVDFYMQISQQFAFSTFRLHFKVHIEKIVNTNEMSNVTSKDYI